MIKINYDKSISLFFELTQTVFLFNLFTMFLFLYVCLEHYLSTRHLHIYFNDKLCGYMYPCHFFYSRIDPELGVAYARTIVIFCFSGLALFMLSWIHFHTRGIYQKIYQEDGVIFARQLFNGWNWGVKSQEECEIRMLNIFNDITLSLREDVKKNEV